MADENEPLGDETIVDLTGDEQDQDQATANDNEGGADEGVDEFSIEIDGEEAQDEPDLVKKLRNEIRERDRELAERRKADAPKIELGPKPKMDDPDVDFDEDVLSDKMEAWLRQKQAADNQEAEVTRAAETKKTEFNTALASHQAKAAALPVKDFQEAQEAVISTLPVGLQSAIVLYSEDSAKLTYALGKHPAKMEAIAKEPDFIKALFMLKDLERNLKVTTRRKPPAPEAETIQRGTASATPAKTDAHLERLEQAAAKSGDRSKVVAYKATLRGK